MQSQFHALYVWYKKGKREKQQLMVHVFTPLHVSPVSLFFVFLCQGLNLVTLVLTIGSLTISSVEDST